jgi:glycine betaine/proline transport system ATP-binding protein
MDPINGSEGLSDLKVFKDALIETVAEKVLRHDKAVTVIDSDRNVVGSVDSSKVIQVLFGSKAGKEEKS